MPAGTEGNEKRPSASVTADSGTCPEWFSRPASRVSAIPAAGRSNRPVSQTVNRPVATLLAPVTVVMSWVVAVYFALGVRTSQSTATTPTL
jgi:hypothetical protein